MSTPNPDAPSSKSSRSEQSAICSSPLANDEGRKHHHNRQGDIPDCPSMESIRYYSAYTPPASRSQSSASVASLPPEDKKEVKRMRKELRRKVREKQREKDLRELYNDYSDSGLSEDEEIRQQALRDLFEPYGIPDPSPEICTTQAESPPYDPEREARERELAERRRQQTQELIDNALYATLSVAQQSLRLFGKMVNYSAKYPTPVGIALILIGFYFTILYLELSAAAFTEWCVQWFWPTTRLFLRCTERMLKKLASFLQEIDDLGQSTYCDMADLWCTEFGLMCHRKCSFLDMALERSRN